jgi:hypothetical protein
MKLIREKGHLNHIKKMSETNFLKPCLEFYSIDNNNANMNHLSLGQNDICERDYHIHPKLCLDYVRDIVYPKLKDVLNLNSIFDSELDDLAKSWSHNLKDCKWVTSHRQLHGKKYYNKYNPPLPYYLKKHLDNSN